MAQARKKVIIIGALGMDFHTFNMTFRDDPSYEVVAFTYAAEQNVGTADEAKRFYPAQLAGKHYPDGIPMIPEYKLEGAIKELQAEEVVFAYSDCSHNEVMHKGSRCLASGADYRLITMKKTQVKCSKPVVAVTAVRTGCGKSQVSRAVYRYLKSKGLKAVAVREPMPYGDLVEQEVMRFATYEDLDKHKCTVEEREEYEPYIEQGLVIYSGVDYEKIARQAEAEDVDVLIFDGGNNEISFFVPDLMFTVVDPLRPGHEVLYHPGEVNARACQTIVINKVNDKEVKPEHMELVKANCAQLAPKAQVLLTDSTVTLHGDAALIKGKPCVVVEDGPTLTHGGTRTGAGHVAAERYGAVVVDPRPFAKGAMAKVYEEFKHLEKVVPAMGYNEQQLKDLEDTLNACDAEVIINGSPLDLAKLVKCNKPIVRVEYDIAAHKGSVSIEETLDKFIAAFVKK